jgi:hypothetical protein
LKDIKHEHENSRKLARNTQKDVYSSCSKNIHTFFMNMVAEKLWNKNFYAWRFGFDKFSCFRQRQVNSCSDPIKTYKNDSVHVLI